MTENKWSGVRGTGFVSIAVVGICTALVSDSAARRGGLLFGYFAFGVLYARASAKRDEHAAAQPLALLAASACAVLLCSFGHFGLAPILLVVLAGTAPFVLSGRLSAIFVVAQTIGLAAVHWVPTWRAQVQWLTYFGFQLFALAAANLAEREAQAAEALRLSHAELIGISALLAEDSRIAERERIARDLHDQLGHSLTALHLQLEAAQHGETRAVASAQALVKEALARLRQVVSAMRDEGFDLRKAVAALAAGTPLRVEVRWPQTALVLRVDIAHALFFCIQEALTNAMKHARAQQVTVSFSATSLHIEDDGQGTKSLVKHNGLLGMRERMQALGGAVSFEHTNGFAIHLTWPAA